MTPARGKPSICPECGWLPGTGRKKSRGSLHQPQTSVAVHRAHAHGVRKWQTAATEDAGWDVSIYQAKPPQVACLHAILEPVPHTEHIRQRGARLAEHHFKLRRAWATELLKRAGWGVWSPEQLVLAMSADQRAAWLEAMVSGEGHTRDGFTRIAQNDGPVAEAIQLAVYLEGWRPTFSRFKRAASHHKPGGQIGMARPHVAASMLHSHEVLETQQVWWVSTELAPGRPEEEITTFS